LGYLCAYYRLARDVQNYRQTIKRLTDQADSNPRDAVSCAEDLFLNNAPDQAMSVLLQHHEYLHASNFLASRLQIREALDLPGQAEQHQPAEAIKIKARTIGTLHFIGRTDQARQLLAEVLKENRLRNDFSTWVHIVEGARQLGMTKEADEYAALALEKATAQDPLGSLFESLRLGNGSAASLWWQFLRQQYSQQTASESLRQLRSIFDQSISRDELEKLDEAARRYAVDLPAVEREPWQETVADTLVALDRKDLANKWISRLEDASSSTGALIHAGDFRAKNKDWPAAARDYDKAWERDRTQAAALFLKGWAVVQGGNPNDGKSMMELAHRLPLGGESGRYALYEVMVRHKLAEDAHRELDLILRATPPRSWERNEALRRTAEELAAKGDPLAAATMWEQAFLSNLTNNVSFMEPWANIVVPALIGKTRALGLIKTGRIDAALAEAKLALDEAPADADALIELVDALDKSAHKPQADALYAQHTAIYRKMVAEYPNSGPLHNQLSWAQVMCHRELDDALVNGKRAVELEPTSTASLDTLTEVYFARGDFPDAIQQIKRCIELEPKVERHRRQLERFKAALSSTTKPS
jgi:tetratricopeptide (TPR) repeat protein